VTVGYYELDLEAARATAGTTGVLVDFKYVSLEVISEEGNELIDSYIFEKDDSKTLGESLESIKSNALKNIESMSNDIKPTIKPTENEDSFDPFNYQRPEE
jgi:hypothetical protein